MDTEGSVGSHGRLWSVPSSDGQLHTSLANLTLPLGFSPFSIDEKPRYGGPDSARDIAFQKITNRVKGVMMARTLLALGAGGLI